MTVALIQLKHKLPQHKSTIFGQSYDVGAAFSLHRLQQRTKIYKYLQKSSNDVHFKVVTRHNVVKLCTKLLIRAISAKHFKGSSISVSNRPFAEARLHIETYINFVNTYHRSSAEAQKLLCLPLVSAPNITLKKVKGCLLLLSENYLCCFEQL